MKNRTDLLILLGFMSLFLLAFSPFEKEAEESVEGRKKYAVGEMAEAEKEFDKAAKRLENNAEAYYDLGNALQGQQKYEEALEAYKKSLESGNATQKLRSDIFHNMANSFAGLGKYQDAEKFYIRSLEEEPSKETAENLEIVRRIIAQQQQQQEQQQNEKQENQDKQEDQEQQDQNEQNQEDQEKQEDKEQNEQNETPDDEQNEEQNQQSQEQNDENNEGNDEDQNSGMNDEDNETQDEENRSSAAEEQDDEQQNDDRPKESSVLKQFKQRKNLQISPFMLKKEQKSDSDQTW